MNKMTPHPKPAKPHYYFKEWRKFRNLTQEELADRIGVSAPAISQIERGLSGFTNSTLEAIADALSCEPGQLLGVNPFKEGQVIDLMRMLDDNSRDMAIRMLKGMTGTGG